MRTLRAERFDLAISIYGQMASLWAFLSGARRSVGYVEESYPFLLSDPLGGGRHRARIHEIEYAQRLGEHVDAPRGNMVQLQVPEDARRRGDRILCRHGVTPSERIVVIHAGAVNGSAKRWPAACWSEFADELIRRINVRVVLAGGRADAELAEEVTACASSPVISLAGETDLVELAAILARADLVASGDSGPLHLARALGRPVLAAYGPTDPAIYGPFSSGAPMRLHRADLPCSPCYTLAATAECPLGDPICMRLIPVRSMVDSALELLAGSEDELAVTQQDALQDPK